MSLTENDLETLEELLDGELAVEQADLLRRRLSAEPELAQAMDRLRTDRQMRAAMWAALEPADAEVDAVINNVRREVNRHELWSLRFRTFRKISGIAAAVAMIFGAGWISSQRLQYGPSLNSTAAPQTVATTFQPQPQPGTSFPMVTGPRITNPPGFDISPKPITNVSDVIPLPRDPNNELFNGPGDNYSISNVRPAYNVVVIDPWGRVIDKQQFETRDDAQKFTEQLNRFQGQQRQNLPHRASDNVIPVTDHP